jgi:hypothetical protein
MDARFRLHQFEQSKIFSKKYVTGQPRASADRKKPRLLMPAVGRLQIAGAGQA